MNRLFVLGTVLAFAMITGKPSWAGENLRAQGTHQNARFDRQAWAKDFEFLKATLERSYSHLAWLGSPEGGVDLPVLNRRTLRALRTAESDTDAAAAIVGFVHGLNDPHLAQAQNLDTTDPWPEPEPRSPDTTSSSACAAYGYSLATRVAFSLPFESLDGFTLESDGIEAPFRSGTIDVGGAKIGIVRIPRFRAAEYPALCIGVWTALHAAGGKADAEAVSGKIDEAWLGTLAERLRRFRKVHVDIVVVDVGGDGGGNDLGDWAVRLFTAKPIHSARLLVSAGPAGVPYLMEQIGLLQKALDSHPDIDEASRTALSRALHTFEERKKRTAEMACDMSWVWRERRHWGTSPCTHLLDAGFASGAADYVEPGTYDAQIAPAIYWASIADPMRGAWDGRVYVLTDNRTASAAEMFAALMHDSVGAPVIGVRTLGLGCGFMARLDPVMLPYSRLAFRIPNCVRLRTDGTDEVAGIGPDVPMPARADESPRARAARLLQTVARTGD